jgi:hypothetical protein
MNTKTKHEAQQLFEGSKDLFEACWKQYRALLLEGVLDHPETLTDVLAQLDDIASYKVNNPKSKFYIYG